MSTTKFYGWVEEVGTVKFHIVLKEAENEDTMYTGVIPIDSIPEEDKKYIEKMSMFELVVDEEGSKFEFCKDVWTQEEIDNAEEKAKEFMAKVKSKYEDIT